MSALRQQLEAAAKAFCQSPEELATLLDRMASDVEMAKAQPLCLFPVIHHSPASAVHMVRYLRTHRPELVMIEACADLRGLVETLQECELPVAMQAYAPEPVGLPAAWAPLSVLTPLTEFSAEFQAIAYALTTPGVRLEFIDRPTDLVFQWMLRQEEEEDEDEDDDDDDGPSGQQVMELGRFEPTFAAFRDVLLDNARMSHFEEWNNLYIEEPTISANTATYREVMYLVGSLFRRLGSDPRHREEMRRRDRFMWSRVHRLLAETGIAPDRAVFICGAAHTCNDDVPEFGVGAALDFVDDPPTETVYHHGLVPSSFSAIEDQFGYVRGAVSLAAGRWKKACSTWGITPFSLPKKGKKGKRPKRTAKPKAMKSSPAQLSLGLLLTEPPNLSDADAGELVRWCTAVVAEARRSRYLASTADAIAIYETSILLARIRGRKRPSAYDFMDAAETCLEKTRVPGQRNIRQCCERVLGADKAGQVGYDAVPPLVRDVYDRLATLGITDKTRGVKRVLMDFDADPGLRDASMLLWRLRQVLPHTRVARPIMGKLELGHVARQESWDVCLAGPEQRAVIELAYSALTVEQVVEQRLNEQAFASDANTLAALEATEASLVLLNNPRLSHTLGDRVSELLVKERDAATAPELFRMARRLVYHFRSTGEPMPAWLERLVVTGFHHYCGLLPDGFGDRGTSPEQIAAVCSFLFTLEGLALSLGCERSQVEIAISQAAGLTTDPEKLGLLWVCEWLVKRKDQHDVRAAFQAVLDHPIGRRAYPRYLGGLLHGVGFAPRAASLAVEQLGKAFAELPDSVLLPWMPSLVGVLTEQGGPGLAAVLRAAKRELPRDRGGIAGWEPLWHRSAPAAPEAAVDLTLSDRGASARRLLFAHRDATAELATAIGASGPWVEALNASGPPAERSERAEGARDLLFRHPQGADAHAAALGVVGEWVRGAAPSFASAPGGPVTELLGRHPAAGAAWAASLGLQDGPRGGR